MTGRKRDDVVIVGAGVTGMSIAWHLARLGIHCTVVERTGVGAGMTSVQAGGVRTQWSSRLTCRLALESRAFYENVEKHLAPSVPPAFRAAGCAFVARTEETLEVIAKRVVLQREEGVTSRTASPAELAGLLPGVRTDRVLGGAFNPVDGYFDRPASVVEAFAEAALREGQTLVHAEVDRLEGDGDRWTVRLGDGSALTAGDVIAAVGCGTPDLLAATGVEVPIRRLPRFLFYSPPVAETCVPALIVFEDDALLVKQLADGRLLAADLRYGLGGRRPSGDSCARIEADLRDLVALPSGARFTSIVEGEYDTTPDQQFLVGQVPERPGLWMAAGLQGRGMMLAPVVGRMVAEALEAGWSSTGAVPEELLPERFSGAGTGESETQVI
ncbi:MAG: hypothetical protein AUI14_05550 [Actinobacteria bacterium 13_2_20CM_2_71_6]|nr:MAG: hypothetical protein AUI14_05550 [Actinobacteria bacterium 13_2_20CM_2_71_6]